MPKKKKKKKLTIHSKETKVILGVIMLILGVAIMVAPFVQDAEILKHFRGFFGKSSVFWGLTLILFSLRTMTSFEYLQSNKRFMGFILAAFTASLFFSFWIPADKLGDSGIHDDYGGILGQMLHDFTMSSVGKLVEALIIVALIIISFSLISGTSMERISTFFEGIIKRIMSIFNREKKEKKAGVIELDGSSSDDDEREFITSVNGNQEEELLEPAEGEDKQEELPLEGNSPGDILDTQEPVVSNGDADTTTTTEGGLLTDSQKYENWEFPPLELLTEPVVNSQDEEIHKRNAVIIERTLQSFDIESKVTKITIGPTIVQFALSITVGTKVSKVKNLTNDLALALATSESQIRVEAPIPGTTLIGIEIPNPQPNFVYIRDVMSLVLSEKEKYQLPLALGKNVAGKTYLQDLVKMPHLLVAGATGTGKSVGINSILTGLLMTKTPDEMKLILVDPKMVELAPYDGLPHLLTPVITDMELVVNALQWAIDEMKTRYRILKQLRVKNIVEYNKKEPDNKMPYIVIIVDEMSDLMQTTGADVDSKILRLAQMARAIGIHLILATQRPDVNVITGVIKANVNGRMAFSVSTQIDSRVIIDQSGAETLIGRGDMLFKSPDKTRPIRIQGAWTDTQDTDKLVQFIKEQSGGEPDYQTQVTKPEPQITANGVEGLSGISEDPLFEQALEQVVVTQKGSSSMLQRKFKIGYNRAARLIDELEAFGVVGPQEGSSPRQVLIKTKEEFVNKLQQQNSASDSPGDEYIDE